MFLCFLPIFTPFGPNLVTNREGRAVLFLEKSYVHSQLFSFDKKTQLYNDLFGWKAIKGRGEVSHLTWEQH
jgi:hypothetical protein